jgi:hypothetical protein
MNHLFQQVESNHQHQAKQVRPAEALQTPTVYLKWYLIEPAHLPITQHDELQAKNHLLEELQTQKLALNNEVGFVVQHRAGDWMILYVCTWRGNNELWETLYHRRMLEDPYIVFERQNTTATFCVWVLAAVAHEQKAWTRFLRSARDEANQQSYLHDQLTAEVW